MSSEKNYRLTKVNKRHHSRDHVKKQESHPRRPPSIYQVVPKVFKESIEGQDYRLIISSFALLFMLSLILLTFLTIAMLTTQPTEGLFKSTCFADRNAIQIDIVSNPDQCNSEDRIWINGIIRHGNTKQLMVNRIIKMSTVTSLIAFPNNTMSEYEKESYRDNDIILGKLKTITGNNVDIDFVLLFKEFPCYYDSSDNSIILDDITFDKKNLSRDIFATIILTFTITSLLYLIPITLGIISSESINVKMSKEPGLITRLFVLFIILLLPSQNENEEEEEEEEERGIKSNIEKSSEKDTEIKDTNNKRVTEKVTKTTDVMDDKGILYDTCTGSDICTTSNPNKSE